MKSNFTRRLAISAGLAALGLPCLGAAGALAQTEVTYDLLTSGSELEIAGEANADLITMSIAGSTITIRDTGPGGVVRHPVNGLTCTNVNPTTVTCPLDPGAPNRPVDEIEADLFADNDSFTSSVPVESSPNGGDGNDSIQGGPVDDSINGGEGNDILNGGDGDDFLDDGGNNLTTGGNDLVVGGNGYDEADSFRAVPVTVTLDGIANDGAPSLGEADNIQAEEIEGGSANDTLIADTGPNTIQAFEGDDVLVGLGGPDALRGGTGDDQLDGGLGPDDLACGAGLDIALLGPGDYFSGGSGNAFCERTGAEITGESATTKKGKVKVRVSCPPEDAVACSGTVVLLSNSKKLSKTGSYTVGAGKTKNAKLKLTDKGRKKLRKAGGDLLVSAEARTTYPNGVSVKETRLQLLGK